MKQIPNILTLLNLFFGCMAIVATLQTGLIVSNDVTTGGSFVMIPEKIYLASFFIGIAAVIDFFDGFVARLIKADSALGKQLDSLSDVVSFGVAPAMIIYQFLRLSFAQQEDGIESSIMGLLPAFIFAMAGAYRLGRFNIDPEQSTGFKGVPIPAAGLVVASFPLIYWNTSSDTLINLFTNAWFWYAVIFVLSYLMISTLPMMALKVKNYAVKDNWDKYLLVLIAIIAALLLNWLAVPIVFLFYVVLSLTLKNKRSHDL